MFAHDVPPSCRLRAASRRAGACPSPALQAAWLAVYKVSVLPDRFFSERWRVIAREQGIVS